MGIRMWTPLRNQGQIVVVSFGWLDGRLYRCTVDRSQRPGAQESWEVARDSNALRALQDEIDDFENPPALAKISWRKCKSPETCYCHACGDEISRDDAKYELGEPYCPAYA